MEVGQHEEEGDFDFLLLLGLLNQVQIVVGGIGGFPGATSEGLVLLHLSY